MEETHRYMKTNQVCVKRLTCGPIQLDLQGGHPSFTAVYSEGLRDMGSDSTSQART